MCCTIVLASPFASHESRTIRPQNAGGFHLRLLRCRGPGGGREEEQRGGGREVWREHGLRWLPYDATDETVILDFHCQITTH